MEPHLSLSSPPRPPTSALVYHGNIARYWELYNVPPSANFMGDKGANGNLVMNPLFNTLSSAAWYLRAQFNTAGENLAGVLERMRATHNANLSSKHFLARWECYAETGRGGGTDAGAGGEQEETRLCLCSVDRAGTFQRWIYRFRRDEVPLRLPLMSKPSVSKACTDSLRSTAEMNSSHHVIFAHLRWLSAAKSAASSVPRSNVFEHEQNSATLGHPNIVNYNNNRGILCSYFVRKNSHRLNAKPERGVRFGQWSNPEPEPCVQFGSVQITWYRRNSRNWRYRPTLMARLAHEWFSENAQNKSRDSRGRGGAVTVEDFRYFICSIFTLERRLIFVSKKSAVRMNGFGDLRGRGRNYSSPQRHVKCRSLAAAYNFGAGKQHLRRQRADRRRDN
ncbi:hypothetical protein C8F04DRAFT_1181500 [Mycena alexandri]|uniref:Uncharacterized protein n=1 Tax=Mycena alexandri TaxID=1745969 RepID=A0AAD6T2N6_9AGAR|nr:hypothetical protein C8F04DRAFT_1181500 [Mycena alexandri]